MASTINSVPSKVLKEAMIAGFEVFGEKDQNPFLKTLEEFFNTYQDQTPITKKKLEEVLLGKIAIAAGRSRNVNIISLANDIFNSVVHEKFSPPAASVSARASVHAVAAPAPRLSAHAVAAASANQPDFQVIERSAFQKWFNRNIKPTIQTNLISISDQFFSCNNILTRRSLQTLVDLFSTKLGANDPTTKTLFAQVKSLTQEAEAFHLSMGGSSASAAAPRAMAAERPSALISGRDLSASLIVHFEAAFGQHANSRSSGTVYRAIEEVCGNGHVDRTQILNNLSDKLKELSETQPNNKGTPWLDLDSYKAVKRALAPLLQTPDDEDDYKEAPPALLHPDWTKDEISREWQDCVSTWGNGGRERAYQMNRIVFEQTMQAITDPNFVDQGLQDQMVQETVYVPRPRPIPADPTRQPIQTAFFVDNASTFDVAERMVQAGRNPLVLDMANRHDIAGEPHKSSTQEEELARRSNLYKGLQKLAGPGGRTYAKDISSGGIYVPHVQVFRKGPLAGYAIHEPFSCSVYASPAFDCNPAHKKQRSDGFIGFDKPQSEEAYQEQTKEKMRSMFRTALHNRHDSVVLGAFGCGAYQNKPEEIAQFYIDVLSEDEFRGKFIEVRFAIIELGNSSNAEPFLKAIQDPVNVAKLTPGSGSSCVIQ
jgi:uncharacterized protein (TIGR02452 family)